MLKLRTIMIVSLLLITIAVGCSSSGETDQVSQALELVIPDNYAKFVDASESFAVYYPSHWDSQYSSLEDTSDWIEQASSSKTTGAVMSTDTSSTHYVLSAVDYSKDDFYTNLNVVMERISNDMTPKEYAEATKELSRIALKSWRLHSEEFITLGGLRGYVTEVSFAFSELEPGLDGRVTTVQMAVKNPGSGIIWVVTCSSESSSKSALETCKTVVNTSRLLN